MARITLLSDEVANKIAAGEVIERPASVVKELVENAIDAGATRIEIEIREGGKEYIRVTDNGEGIEPDDVPLAFERHATSKISSADDLFRLQSLGFRGEALPSISSVSRLQMITRAEGLEAGTEIAFSGGKREKLRSVGSPVGTTVIVRNLFFNTPARFKFLKKTATEKRYIAELVLAIALAHPEISFQLTADSREVLVTPGNGNLADVIASTMGRSLADKMIPVTRKKDGLLVDGYIGPPEVTRRSRKGETIIVNGRPVANRMIASAIEKGFQGFLPPRHFPVAVVRINAEAPEVDVNVHPAKTEVRFRNESEIYKSVLLAVKGALVSARPIPDLKQEQAGRTEAPKAEKPYQQDWLLATKQSIQVGEKRREEPEYSPLYSKSADLPLDEHEQSRREVAVSQATATDKATDKSAVRQPLSDQKSGDIFAGATILGQVARTYIVLAAPDGMLLIDQHVAHERVLYERLRKKRAERKEHSQPLLTPITLELPLQQAQVLQEHLNDLAELGLSVEPFGQNTFLVRSLPADFRLVKTGQDIVSLIEEFATEFAGKKDARDELVTMMSCKGAIKAGMALTYAQMQKLLADLAGCENPYRCPHGRPIVVRIDRKEIDRRFGR